MFLYRNSLYFIREVSDLLLLNSCLYFSLSVVSGSFFITKEELVLFFFATIFWIILTRSLNVYDDFRSRNFTYEVIPFIKAVLAQSVGLIVILFLMKYEVPRSIIVYLFLSFISLGIIQKFIIRQILNYYRRKGLNQRYMLIIGAGSVGRQFYNIVTNNPHFGYNVIGFLDDKKPESMDGEYIGPISALDNILIDIKIDNVMIALPNYAYRKIEDIISVCEKNATRVKIIPNYFKLTSGKFSVSMLGKFPVFSLRDERINEYQCRIVKRLFDLLFSSLVIVFILSWAVPLIGLMIKLTSRGSIIFKQERWGRENNRFYAYKFRTMVYNSKDVDQNGKYVQASQNDPRITKIGKFLRKTNLDELPQFFNVFMGSMSVVGPRPHPTPLNQQSQKDIKHYLLRHLVKPGITGWAQANGYRGETKDNRLMQKRVDYDLWYIENWSFWLDIQIIFLTVWRMFRGDPNAY